MNEWCAMRRRPEISYHRGQTFISLDDYIDMLMERGGLRAREIAAYIICDVLGEPNSWAEVEERITLCRENAKRVRDSDRP